MDKKGKLKRNWIVNIILIDMLHHDLGYSMIETNYESTNYVTGTIAYDKMQDILMKKTLLDAIKHLSLDAFTCFLEHFHSTLN